MKHRLLLLLLFCSSALWANNSAGDKNYERHDFEEAIEDYKATIEKSHSDKKIAYAQYMCGKCYSALNRPVDAVEMLDKAIQAGYTKDDIYLVYGKNLQKVGDYDRAKEAFISYDSIQPKNTCCRKLIESCDWANMHSGSVSENIEVRLDSIDTDASEYGIGYFDGGIIYASTKYNEDDKQRSQMYYAPRSENFTISYPVSKKMVKQNYGEHVGSFAVDTVNGIFYYTRCVSHENNETFIYYSVKKKDKWKSKGVFPIGDRRTFAAHPALSDDGQRMYFTSNMPGGYGGTDIWYIEKNEKGRWNMKPINAGAVVNTTGNEAFPYVCGNYLIFASDGHVGFGGYDLFSATIDGPAISNVRNMMRPINSSYDDTNLILSKENNEAFLVSGRQPDTNDDIYRISDIFTSQMISGHVYEKETMTPIAKSHVNIVSMIDGGMYGIDTDENGYYYQFVETGDCLKMTATSPGYDSDMGIIKTGAMELASLPIQQDFYLQYVGMSISGRVYDLETNVPFVDETVILMSNGIAIQQTKTDEMGRYMFLDLEADREYQVVVDKENFLTISSHPFVYNQGFSNSSNFDLASISVEAAGGGEVEAREISLGEIYFDFDSYEVLPASEPSLQRVIMLMNSNPQVKMEVGSHTDVRGTEEYNFKLSVERAKSVVRYLVDHGIDRSRLTWRGYGKRNPKIKNATTEAEHRMNRNTTFKVIER